MEGETVMKTLMGLSALALAAVSISACGRMADLEAPAPRETERAPRDGASGRMADPATVNRPPSQLPIDGGPVDPLGGRAADREPR